jgi:hypothetical protein
VQRELNDGLEGVDSMMLIRTGKTDVQGEVKRDEDIGSTGYEDDGC